MASKNKIDRHQTPQKNTKGSKEQGRYQSGKDSSRQKATDMHDYLQMSKSTVLSNLPHQSLELLSD